jgi:hypothetical protein
MTFRYVDLVLHFVTSLVHSQLGSLGNGRARERLGPPGHACYDVPICRSCVAFRNIA